MPPYIVRRVTLQLDGKPLELTLFPLPEHEQDGPVEVVAKLDDGTVHALAIPRETWGAITSLSPDKAELERLAKYLRQNGEPYTEEPPVDAAIRRIAQVGIPQPRCSRCGTVFARGDDIDTTTGLYGFVTSLEHKTCPAGIVALPGGYCVMHDKRFPVGGACGLCRDADRTELQTIGDLVQAHLGGDTDPGMTVAGNLEKLLGQDGGGALRLRRLAAALIVVRTAERLTGERLTCTGDGPIVEGVPLDHPIWELIKRLGAAIGARPCPPITEPYLSGDDRARGGLTMYERQRADVINLGNVAREIVSLAHGTTAPRGFGALWAMICALGVILQQADAHRVGNVHPKDFDEAERPDPT